MTEPVEIQAVSEVVTSEANSCHLVENLQFSIDTISASAERASSVDPCNQIIETPAHNERKPWMDYRAVTDTSSAQYELLSRAYHADNGLLYVDGHLAVAIGSGYGPVGTRYEMDIGGTTYKVIKADAKNDAHTLNGEGLLGTDGHLIEMIVDTDLLDSEAMYTGDCDCLVPGTVTEIRRIEE